MFPNRKYARVSFVCTKTITFPLKEGHSKCTDLIQCFSLSFHHKYTQLPVVLSSVCFYLTLSARKFKTTDSSFKRVGAVWFPSTRRTCRPSEQKVINDLKFFFCPLEHNRWERNKAGEVLLKVFFLHRTIQHFLNFLSILNHFPCRFHIHLQSICRRSLISDLTQNLSCILASAVCIPIYCGVPAPPCVKLLVV